MAKQWIGNIKDLRESYRQIAEDMKRDHKPRSLEVKVVANNRTLELNAVFHIVIRQIRKHLFDGGLGFVEYEDEITGKRVRMPLDEEMVKGIVKDQLGTKFTVLGSEIAKPTRLYSQEEMVRTLGKIDSWCSTDLNLQIVYKSKLEAIAEKYGDDV